MVQRPRFDGDLLLPRINATEHTDLEDLHTWVELRETPRILSGWKEAVLDNAESYTQVQDSFGRTGWYLNDTIYTLTTLAENISDLHNDLSDAFLRTAGFASWLVLEVDPFELPSQPKSWKLDIAVRLLLTIFRDLHENPIGFFAGLLGVPLLYSPNRTKQMVTRHRKKKKKKKKAVTKAQTQRSRSKEEGVDWCHAQEYVPEYVLPLPIS